MTARADTDGQVGVPPRRGGALPAPGPHGGDGARVAAALGLRADAVLDLSASLNPVAPDVAALVRRHLGELRRYPDVTSSTAALAAALDVGTDRVLLTNGGAEAIALVAAEIGGRVVEPEFSLHPRDGTALWRSNPHNPSGRLAPPGQRAAVWDEAFYPLATGRWTRGDADAVVVGSLTKVFACPGLRLGYVVAAPERIAALARRQPAWSVGALAAAAVPDLLAIADLATYRDRIAALRADLVGLLDAHGLAPQPSDANFVLCERAAGLRERLAPHRVLVRDCASFGLPGAARVAVPDADGLVLLEAALRVSAP
jgi:histidinol-phosphate/aromatic aminotransferase/cobyric acid decarboxylase-like protein